MENYFEFKRCVAAGSTQFQFVILAVVIITVVINHLYNRWRCWGKEDDPIEYPGTYNLIMGCLFSDTLFLILHQNHGPVTPTFYIIHILYGIYYLAEKTYLIKSD